MKPASKAIGLILKRYFVTLLVRQFGVATRTVNVPQDPTVVQRTEGYILFEHPLIGPVQYRAKYYEAHGVECVELKRTPLVNEDQRCDNCFRPTIDDGDAVHDIAKDVHMCHICRHIPNNGWGDEYEPYAKEIAEEELRFTNFDEHVLSAGCSAEQREPFSDKMCDVIDWILEDAGVQFGKTPFHVQHPDFACIY